MVQGVFVYVCPCVQRLSARKSAVTFDSLNGSVQNFQGLLNSSQVIFGQVTRTPGPSVSGPDPRKRRFLPNLSPLGVLGQGGRVTPFRNRDGEANKTLGAEF